MRGRARARVRACVFVRVWVRLPSTLRIFAYGHVWCGELSKMAKCGSNKMASKQLSIVPLNSMSISLNTVELKMEKDLATAH